MNPSTRELHMNMTSKSKNGTAATDSSKTLNPNSSFDERMKWLDATHDAQELKELRSQLLMSDVATVEDTLKELNDRFSEHTRYILNNAVKRTQSSFQFAPKDALLNFIGILSDNELWARWECRHEKIQATINHDEAQTDRLIAQTTLWESRLEKLHAMQSIPEQTRH